MNSFPAVINHLSSPPVQTFTLISNMSCRSLILTFSVLCALFVPGIASARWKLPTALNKVSKFRSKSNRICKREDGKQNWTQSCKYRFRSGFDFLRKPWLNKGSSFTHQERQHYRIQGLVPAGEPIPLSTKVYSAISQFRKQIRPIDKYTYLHTLQDTDETLYYSLLTQHTVEVLPFVYTPVVGQACQEWSHLPHVAPRGLYLSINDRGNIRNILKNYPLQNINAIVVTDGERILGLGDLGCNGMGIPVGKLALYSACAGIHPQQCLPVHIDVGTNTASLLADPTYPGLKQPRVRGQAYDALINEFVIACQEVFGRNVLIQFEDFANENAFRLLNKFKDNSCAFNDDIQGTAAVVVSGLLSSLRLLGPGKQKLVDQTFLFSGAGSAGVGVADLLSSAIVAESKGEMTLAEARKRIWLVDSQGLVTAERDLSTLQAHKVAYAHTVPNEMLLRTDSSKSHLSHAVELIQPTALLGMSAQQGSFTKEICQKMAALNDKPIIFALSNPTDKSECTASEAYAWTNGQCIFASGSPFANVKEGNTTFVPGQCNNAYIFPAMGLAAVVTGASKITDDDFYTAAFTLSRMVSTESMQNDGCLFPSFSVIRQVSLEIAVAVAAGIIKDGRASNTVVTNKSSSSKNSGGGEENAPSLRELCLEAMYDPMLER